MPLPYVNCLACLYLAAAEASVLLGDTALADRLRAFAVQNVPQRYWCPYGAHKMLGVPLSQADGPRIGIALRKRRRAAA
jgi:hypothetical protein